MELLNSHLLSAIVFSPLGLGVLCGAMLIPASEWWTGRFSVRWTLPMLGTFAVTFGLSVLMYAQFSRDRRWSSR